mmetsp:Transcript_2369/g.4945  ORF Transcript_2369/g.4945 Transcript_2369/m.4945 type:complete len:105 (-) Transcript_2369:3-317(-)
MDGKQEGSRESEGDNEEEGKAEEIQHEVVGGEEEKSEAAHDVASRPETEEEDDGDESARVDQSVSLTFPQRLMELLEDGRQDDLISWDENGRMFNIHRKAQSLP